MAQKITWQEMKESFPDQWLLIVDYDLDESGHLISGVVERHSKSKSQIYAAPQIDKPAAFRFTGESSFAGLRSHAGH
ncbi:MAG: hypothetical protein CVV49_13045 [Spirochaetae bacterium HGW-Spirochaetae-5]|nr:MAG: hypothetical protein CVV49_13045 [Spirochaetae bacterium HGW-Spirochaetae-5]